MALIFTTTGFTLGATGATVTLTHGLGVTPDMWYAFPSGTWSGAVSRLSWNTQVIQLAAQNQNMVVDVECAVHHSIIK